MLDEDAGWAFLHLFFHCHVTSARALWGNHVLCVCALVFSVLLLCLSLLVTCSRVRSASMRFRGGQQVSRRASSTTASSWCTGGSWASMLGCADSPKHVQHNGFGANTCLQRRTSTMAECDIFARHSRCWAVFARAASEREAIKDNGSVVVGTMWRSLQVEPKSVDSGVNKM